MMTVRESVYAFMRETGLTTVFGNPGSTELPYFKNWPADFDYVLGLQESAALSMADGYAQVADKPAIVNLHSAAGLGHAMGSLVTAYKNNTPLIVVAGQQARSILPYEPFLGATDPTAHVKPYVKWACEPARAQDVPRAFARAYSIAMSAPRGPVFISVPVDDWDQRAEPVQPVSLFGAPAPEKGAVAHAADLLSKARSPVIVSGPEVDRAGGLEALVALAEKLACPVWASPMASRICFPESHNQFAGFLPAREDEIVARLSKHDLVLVFGAPAFQYHFHAPAASPLGGTIIQFSEDQNTTSYTPRGVAIVGNVRDALLTFDSMAPARPIFKRALREAPALRRGDEQALTLPASIDLIEELRPECARIFEEAPSARSVIQARLRMNHAASFFATASGGLGFALSAAVGAALADSSRKTIALVGDGSSLYTVQALWTAAQRNLDVGFIILNNQSYEALKHISAMMQTPAVGADLPGVNFTALAQGFGVAASSAETEAGARVELEKMFSLKGPALLEMRVS
ncbi:benzoylformate decarboxylase [Hyphococcus luteus]|uniref:Benzoylformate decarboxylase n=1 Tax=Hyphococcus luteus TaxID=2058213 RepID=A0A2S7K347_9PROT|nr:benzoylformate decarboxylase [Marinicaulis flavus]PQA86868.1 benzoylformate decarboxylase [Marinicaulis flavus]